MTGPVGSIEISARMYGVLLKAYPVSFRREYADEMMLVFREEMAREWRERGMAGVVALWFRVFGDLAWTIPEEHLSEMQRSMAMRNAALFVLSGVLTAVAFGIIFMAMMFVVCFPLMAMVKNIEPEPIAKLLVFYLAPFLTGLLLTRAKPFFAPLVTVPVALMTTFLIFGAAVALTNDGPHRYTWIDAIACTVFCGTMALSALGGCLVARKASDWLARFSVSWIHVAASLAVLVCSSSIACAVRVTLEIQQLDGDVRMVLNWCLFGILMIMAVTVAHLGYVFARSYCRNGNLAIGQH